MVDLYQVTLGEAAWGGSVAEWLERRIEIRRSRVQIPFWPLADVALGSPEFNFSSTLVNSQLVCLPPVGILNQVMFIYHYNLFTLVLKSPDGEWPITYTFTFTFVFALSSRNETHTAKFKSAAILALACFYRNGAIHSHARAWLKYAHSFDRCGVDRASVIGSQGRYSNSPRTRTWVSRRG